MSNALTQAAHGLSLAEKRIVMLAVSKLNPTAAPPASPGAVLSTKVTAAEYSDLAECTPQTAYPALRDAAKHLFERKISFYLPAHKRNGKSIGETYVQMRWVGQAQYHQKEGWVELYWWPPLLPHLVSLKKNFTTYQLQQATALRSVYSWKLLELLLQFESSGWLEITIEDFSASMEATEKQRQNFGKIRTRIIEPAVKELNEKDGWKIKWKPIKAGRRVKALRFDFKRDPQGKLF